MNTCLGIDHTHARFDSTVPPALRVEPGEVFTLRAASLLDNELFGVSDEYERMAIPITGPVHVQGAAAGTVLRVDVRRIRLADAGAMVTIPGRGAFSHHMARTHRVVRIRDGQVWFDDDTPIPLDPMVGKIGVSPAGPAPSSSTVGGFGGNMDCREVRAGCSVLLPVQVDGALLYAGDLHAAQGDGESSMTAVETAGEIELSCAVLTDLPLARPIVLTPDTVFTIGDGESLDEAARAALDDMLALLVADRGWTPEEAAMFVSAAGNVGVCQLVNPRLSARVGVPFSAFRSPRHRDLLRCPAL